MRKLEKKYRRELVVVGIHSPKFPAERDTEQVRRAAFRHRIECLVINDADMAIWSAWEASAWPTFVILDPYGNTVARTAEKPSFAALDRIVGQLAELFDCEINRAPIPQHEAEQVCTGEAAFPLRVLATDGRLFVADTGNHRILLLEQDGRIAGSVGSGEPGFVDGDAESACFNGPAGLCRLGDALYVADVENHAIREIALETGRVTTVAGTGERGVSLLAGPARDTALSSPWGLAAYRGQLVVAMAGSHSLWYLQGDQIVPIAGNGMERLVDGPLRRASFNQPTDVTVLNDRLFVADSQASAIRVVDLSANDVDTVVGLGLFDCGDADGIGDAVRLQHPLAIAAHGGRLLLADSYNHKVKRLDPVTRECLTIAGDGMAGNGDGTAPRLFEPAGLTVAGDRLYVADRNNHSVRVIDLESGQTSTLRPHSDWSGST